VKRIVSSALEPRFNDTVNELRAKIAKVCRHEYDASDYEG
jgi:hypothetical protein